MKKSLIALAALATVGAAQAQSSVTVYGTYDVGYNSASFDNVNGATNAAAQTESRGVNNVAPAGALTSNRIGFRGTEDLGGGLSARFNLEYGFFNNLTGDAQTADNGTANSSSAGAFQTRTSRVGLASKNLGSVDVGYGLTGLFATVSGHSPLPGNNFIGDLAYTSTASSGADSRILVGAVRMTGVNYYTPTFNGFSARADWGAGSNKDDAAGANDTRVSNAGLTVNYAAGKLAVAATVHQLKTDASTASAVITTTDFQAISARYALTPTLALNALYAKNKQSAGGVQSSKNDVMQVGVKYDMGKTSLVAQYGEGEGEGANASTAQRDRKGYQVGAIYSLSKRTNVYGIYGYQDMKYVDTSVKEKAAGYAVGVRHSF